MDGRPWVDTYEQALERVRREQRELFSRSFPPEDTVRLYLADCLEYVRVDYFYRSPRFPAHLKGW